jgi:hypothetical protein
MSPRNQGRICFALLALAGRAAAMPQDSTVFWKIPSTVLLEDYIGNGSTLAIPQTGVPSTSVLELQATVYSNPSTDGFNTVEVDNFERSANGETNPPAYQRDRGGNINYKGSGFYISGGYVSRYTDPPGHFLGLGRFSGQALRGAAGTGGILRYNGSSSHGWLRIKYKPSQSTSTNPLSQPYAVKTFVVPIGSWNIDEAATQGKGKMVTFDMLGLQIQPNRVLYHQTLYNDFSQTGTVSANSAESFKSTAPSGSCGQCGATTLSGHDKAFNYGLNKSGNTDDDYGTGRNRGFTLVQTLAAQCGDGAGGFTESNVGARTVQAYVNQAATLSGYGGCHGTLDGIHVIESAGDDVWGTSDKLWFSHKGYTGNKNFICRVDQQENTNAWARSGIMIRTGTGAGDENVALFVTPGNGINFQYRGSPNGSTATLASVAGVAAPIWLRLEYLNGVTRAYRSTNGTTWTQIGNGYTKTLSSAYRAGLAATSRSNAPNTSVYSGLSGF